MRHLPLVYGLLGSLTTVSSLMIGYRLLGVSRWDALYLACLTFSVLMYFVNRRILRRK